MGSTQSSSSSDASDTNEEISAPKRNRRLFRSDKPKDKKSKKSKDVQKTPTLHPNARRVVRAYDSQVIYNHGKVGIHGLGPETQGFPCICDELESSRAAALESNANKVGDSPSPSRRNLENNSNNAPEDTSVRVVDLSKNPSNPSNVSTPPSSPASKRAVTREVDPQTGRCSTCGGVVPRPGAQDVQAFPSCNWHDGATIGSLLNSMILAQRDFSESLRQVQTEEQPLVALSRMTKFDMPTLRALQSVFTSISGVDGSDNLISARELCLATGTQPESLLGKALFRLMDITRSNQINFRTWVLMLAKLSPTASLEDKIGFAFNLYDDNGDGFVERSELIPMLRSAIPELSEGDAMSIIESVFAKTDQDGDNKITIEDYRTIAATSADFYEAFTIDVPSLLKHYNVISQAEIEHRVVKLRERDARQDEKLLEGQAKEQAFMERDEDDLHVVEDIDMLDIE